MTPERKAELLKRAERFAYSLTNPGEVGQLSRDALEMAQALDAAERRAADAEADATAIRSLAAQCEAQWPEPGRTAGEIVTAAVGALRRRAESAEHRLVALANALPKCTATVGDGFVAMGHKGFV